MSFFRKFIKSLKTKFKSSNKEINDDSNEVKNNEYETEVIIII